MSLCYRLILDFIIVVIELPLELVVVSSPPASLFTGSGRSGWRRRRRGIIRRLGSSSIVRGG